MKTIVIINGKNPLQKTGGYQSYTRTLGLLLTELGYSVKIVCLDKTSRIIKTTFGEIHTVASPLLRLPIIKSYELVGLILFAPQLAFYIRKFIKNDAIFYGIGPWSFAAILLKIFRKTKDAKIISYLPTSLNHESNAALQATRISDYGYSEKTNRFIGNFTVVKWYSILEYLIVRYSDYIINHYQSAEKILKNQFKADKNKLIRLPYYIEFTDTKPEPIQTKHPLILLICRHDARKGINYLLHAFKEMTDNKIPFSAILIGDGPLLQKNRKLSKKLKLTNVSIVGFVPNPISYLEIADIYAFPSVEEGSSAISILEAMKVGLPIVSTDVDGIPEDLTHEKSALLVEPMNSGAIAQALEKLIHNPDFAKKLGAEAKKEFLKKHDRENTKKALTLLFEKIW